MEHIALYDSYLPFIVHDPGTYHYLSILLVILSNDPLLPLQGHKADIKLDFNLWKYASFVLFDNVKLRMRLADQPQTLSLFTFLNFLTLVPVQYSMFCL